MHSFLLHRCRNIVFGMTLLLCPAGFSQEELPDFYRIHQDIQNFQPINGEITFTFDDSSFCRVDVINSIISGSWKSYYKSGKLKANGFFIENKPAGTWKVFAPTGRKFVILDYGNDERYRMQRVRTGLFRNPVKAGRGSVQMTAFGTSEVDSASAFSSIVHYKNGLKHGHVTEYFLNGEKRGDYNFNEGMYHGRYLYYQSPSRLKFEAEYHMGVPVGKWVYYDNNKQIQRIEDYTSEPYLQRVPGRGFVSEREVMFQKKFYQVIHASHQQNSELFEPDSSGVSLFSILRNAYITAETEFYSDMNLTEPVSSSILRPNLSGLDHLTEAKLKPVMLFFSDFYYYSLQLSDVRNMVLVLTMVCSYQDENDNEKLVALPFLYLPEAYNDLKDKMLHNQKLSDLFMKILQSHYVSYPVYIHNLKTDYLYELDENANWIVEGLSKRLEMFNMTHDLWLYQTGVIR
jgi:antitoxin component YwqK of YwqJK toxin-antitoxin module